MAKVHERETKYNTYHKFEAFSHLQAVNWPYLAVADKKTKTFSLQFCHLDDQDKGPHWNTGENSADQNFFPPGDQNFFHGEDQNS